MPNLPTLTITQPQLDACVAAFGDAAPSTLPGT